MEDAESRLCQDLKWAGLQWDEGMEDVAIVGDWAFLTGIQAQILAVPMDHTSRYMKDVSKRWTMS